MPGTKPHTAYEQPLNERIRILLRLEFLFQQALQGLNGDSEWHSRAVVASLLDIISVLSARGDIRAELIRELDRIVLCFDRLADSPEVDQARLEPLLEEARQLAEQLKAARGLPAAALKRDELLRSVLQRAGIPGGACGFDLPAYQFWLQRPAEERRAQLEAWLQQLEDLRRGNALILRVLRESAEPVRLTAPKGVYQRTPDKKAPQAQLIRVLLPANSPYFAEISGSKYFFTIRFMQQHSTSERPAQTGEDVEFLLCSCGF
ncbi:MAG: cell division protein ZapD [Xanthomonadaceae bacterium]|nr:cell division protein ZapD [Xanthomonadaceae bacterium]